MNQQIKVELSVTKKLSDYAVNFPDDQITEQAIHGAKRCLIDWIGVALGGSEQEGPDILLETANYVGGNDDASIIGRKEKIDILHGALINGFLAHVLDYDDTHLDSFVHPSAPVWPAIAAICEKEDLNGLEALRAFVIGFEVETRIGRVLFRHHDQRGWHMSGMAGGFGAAAAVGRLLKLDAKQMQTAFGIAATYASGLRSMFGTMSKSLHPGKAAMSGLYGALLAKRGFTSAMNVLEADRGYFAVNAAEKEIQGVIENLGEDFEIFYNSVKPYSSGVVTHPIIDAAIALKNEYNIPIDEIKRIVAYVNHMVPDVTGKHTPSTGLEGKFSVYHCLAAGYIDGQCGPEQFSDGRVQSSDIIKLRGKINIEVNPNFHESEAKVVITTNGGRQIEHYVPQASGTADNPLSDYQLEQKYSSMAYNVIGREQTKSLAEKIWRLDESILFSDLMAQTQPK